MILMLFYSIEVSFVPESNTLGMKSSGRSMCNCNIAEHLVSVHLRWLQQSSGVQKNDIDVFQELY